MPELSVELSAPRRRNLVPGEFGVTATFTNSGSEPTYLNTAQASHPALVLEVEDSLGERVPMRPPDAPRPDEGGRGEAIPPGGAVAIGYAGFLDRSQAPGRYRVRYAGAHPPLGGSTDEPLVSGWLDFALESAGEFESAAPLPAGTIPAVGVRRFFELVRNVWHAFACIIRGLLGERCERVLTRSVDEARTEVMTEAPAGFEAWNGTYSWRARFRVRVDQGRCRVTATIRLRLVGAISAAERNAWESAIEGAWSGAFKVCCFCCCCRGGFTVAVNVVFVDGGEDQVVNVGASTTSMGSWGRTDTVAVRHEVGHMLGARGEYYTVDGTGWGLPFQAGKGIMNNPGEGPLARHYGLVARAVEDLLGTSCRIRPAADRC